MAKRQFLRGAEAAESEPVTITYDLYELPTAQHKAGLAGLLLQIGSMKNRKKTAPEYRWDENEPSTKVHVDFTKESTESLFDDLYDATWIEGAPREKPFFKGKGVAKKEVPPVRRTEVVKTDKNGNEKTVEGYVYLELTPALPTLRHYLPEKGEWVRLWRDLIWQVIRDSKKKAPFIQRAAAKTQPESASLSVEPDAETGDAEEEDEKGKGDGGSWKDLTKYRAALLRKSFALGELSSALLIGAQAVNAESISFTGRVEQNLLLHFWLLTAMVYVPRFIDIDGNSHIGRRDKKDKSQHFCIAVPEVGDLKGFLADYPRMLAGLGTETAVFRPKEAIIDIAAEGGISFIEHLARLVPQIAGSGESSFCVSAVDYVHLNKEGNIVRSLTTGRVAFSARLAEKYLDIVGRAGQKPPYGNPLFRRALMLALLGDVSWFRPFGKLFAEWPAEFFVQSDKSPKSLSWFWTDARKKIQEVIQAMPTNPHPNAPPPEADDLLMTLIHRLVRTYLGERAKAKSGIDPEKFKIADKIEWDKIPPKYGEERRNAGESLFLEFRSRRDQAFVQHFSQTLFAAKQFLSEDQCSEIGRALLHRTDDVKTLTLMALSANS
jgi:CRISPR-associated protein Cmx8